MHDLVEGCYKTVTGKEESESAVETARGKRRKRSEKVNIKEQERAGGEKDKGIDICIYTDTSAPT